MEYDIFLHAIVGATAILIIFEVYIFPCLLTVMSKALTYIKYCKRQQRQFAWRLLLLPSNHMMYSCATVSWAVDCFDHKIL